MKPDNCIHFFNTTLSRVPHPDVSQSAKTTYGATRHSYPKKNYILFLLSIFLFLTNCQKKQSETDIIHSFKGPFPDTISIMEYNVENLFDMVDNGMEYPEFKPNANNWTRSTFQTKLENTASVIAALHADVAVLLEIENENAVSELQKVLKEKKCPYPFRALGDKPNRTITIPVILSRFPLFAVVKYATPLQGTPEISRNLLEANVFLGADTLKIFACHWPSKKEKESARVSAAQVLKTRLEQLLPKTPYILAGDFNENYDESSTFHTQNLDDTHGTTGLNHILRTAAKQSGCLVDYVTKKNIHGLGGLRHFDPWLDIAEEKRMSEIFRHQNNTPDHLLLCPALLDSSGLSYVDCSFRVFTWDARLLMNGEPYRWQLRFENKQKIHRAEGFSDHLPIVLQLRKGPFHAEDSSADGSQQTPGKRRAGVIGFETGREGWIAGAKKISISRDSKNPRSGAYCLKIAGEAGKQNGCAAKASIPCFLGRDSSQHSCVMNLRGRATLSVRIKTSRSEKWTYYNGAGWKPSKNAKYTYYDLQQWTTIALPLEPLGLSISETTVELRVKKESPIELWIDDISVK